MRFQPNRGAARVSAVWIIVLAVLFLAALAFGFISQSDMATQRDRANAAAVSANTAQEDMLAARDMTRQVSLILGYYDEESADKFANPEAAASGLDDLKTVFPDLGSNVDNFSQAVQPIIDAYGVRGRKIAELEGRIAELEGELSASNDATRTVENDKDSIISDLRQQLSDQEETANRRQSELEGRLEAANEENTNLDLASRTTAAQATDTRRALEKELLARDTRIKALSDVTKFAKEPHASKPDGAVIATSGDLPLGWIDVGSENRLTTGTRFEVRTGDVDARFKGMCEVTKVEANRAEVVFFDVVDRFDPITTGDVIINKLFDPVGGRNAVLLGRFSGAYTEPELKVFLERMGINVQPKLDLTTHFLIVGAELYNDPDTNEPLDEPIQPSELPVFKDAEALGVQIVPLQDVRQFFSTSAYDG